VGFELCWYVGSATLGDLSGQEGKKDSLAQNWIS